MDERQLKIILKMQDDASKELRKVVASLDGAEVSTNKWTDSLSKMRGVALGASAAVGTALVGLVGYGLKVAGELETAEIGLKTLLGSSEKAAKTVERLKVEAARTPFELPGLTQATQLLTSVTKDGDKSIDILLNVGEALAAMGKGQTELDRIIINLQQVASVGKASMIDIKQFAFAGVPIFDMLEEHFKNTGTQSVVNNTKELTKNATQISKLKDQIKVASMQQAEFTSKTKASTKAASEMKLTKLKTELASLESTTKALNATNGKTATSFTSVADAIENGQVTFDLLVELFDKANDKGGRFFNAYINQAGSFQQLTSNMKDAFGIFLSDVMKSTGIFEGSKKVMSTMIDVMYKMIAWAKENPKLTQAIIATAAAFAILVPTIVALATIFALINPYTLALAAAFAAIVAVIGIVATNFKEIIGYIDQQTGLITFLSEVWNLLVTTFREMLLPALMELWAALQPYLPLLEMLAKLFGVILIVAIGLFVMAIAGLAVTLGLFLTAAAKVEAFLLNQFSKAWDWINNKITAVMEVVDSLIVKFEKAIELASRISSKVGGALSGAVNMVLPGRASGGPVTGGSPYMVGEKGPEMFIPGSSGRIIPNGGMGGVTVNVYGDVTGEDLVDKVSKALADRIKYRTATA